jgi:hypothetical protein
MRISPNTDTVPRRVSKFLLPHEMQVAIYVHQHPAKIIPSLVKAIGGLLAAIVISPVVKGDVALGVTIRLLVIILMAQLALTIFDWFSRYLVITNSRMFICCGFLAPEITWSSPLAGIQDITLKRSIGGRYGYGTLVLASEHLAIDYVPYPQKLYLEITGMLFREGQHGDDQTESA